MPTHIALLRGVNVGGKTTVSMSELRTMLAELGLSHPHTLLQSGNLVFDVGADAPNNEALETLLETEIERRFGHAFDVLVRNGKDWARVIAKNPFPAEAKDDPSHLVVMALKRAPKTAAVTALQAAIKGREVVQTAGRHAYIVYPDGIGTSKLTNVMIEKTLGTRGTARNWNTVLKLAEMVRSSDGERTGDRPR
jgi:uncharacterized protein (DUF1697 family)